MENSMLLIDDDPEMQRAVASVAEDLGYSLDYVADGETGLQRGLRGDYGIVVVDLKLPGISGMDICKELRLAKPALPIIMLTSRADELSVVLGFELGADEYITKPFRLSEFVARVRALLRRSDRPRSRGESPVYRVADLVVDANRRTVSRGNKELVFTRAEFDLLAYLAAREGAVVSREELMECVWGYRSGSYDGTITTCLGRVRAKIEDDPANPRFILTVRGIGYRLTNPLRPRTD